MPSIRHRLRIAAVWIAVLATACASDDEDPAAAPATTPVNEATAPVTTPAPVTTAPTAATAGSPTSGPAVTTGGATTEVATSNVATTDVATTEVATTEVATSAPAAELPAPGALGPFGVGRSTVTVTDEARARPLTIDVWYPIAPGTTGAPAIFSFAPGIELPSEVAIADAPVAAGPFPLVVYSHGSGGVRYIASFFTETLASHGFVVAAPDHVGNTAVELITGAGATMEQNALDRPRDVSFVIDQLLAKSADPADALAGAVDAQRIGVAGHSAGGYTALAGVTGITVEATTVPADARIRAIVGMAPATGRFSDAELAAIEVPTMLLVGTDDATTPVDPNVTRPWSLLTATPRYRVEFIDAGHQSFTDVCRYQQELPALGTVPQVVLDTVDAFAVEGCAPELMPIERAHELTNTYSVSFFKAHLAGEAGYAALIAPDAVAGPDVTVEIG